MELEIEKPVKVHAKTLKVFMKVCDEFAGQLVDQDGAILLDYEGYVPGFFPGDHYGDYLILDIDIDTGHIVNWKTPTKQQMQEFIAGRS